MYKIYVTRYMLRFPILIIDSYDQAQIDNYLISHLHIFPFICTSKICTSAYLSN
jgi:hypothetical protein